MLLEIDEVVMDIGEWELVKSGDKDAIARTRDYINGLELYLHNFWVDEGTLVVTLRELQQLHVIDSVTVNS